MARARLLKPGFFTNEDLAELPFEARLLFAGLWTLADREGRLEDRPKRIGAAIFPYDVVDADALLTQLAGAGFILRYEVLSQRFIQIVTWKAHQKPHERETKSEIPAPGASFIAPGLALGEPEADQGAPEEDPGQTKASLIQKLDPEAEAEAEAETVERAPEHPFAYTFARKYQERHAGRPPPPVEHAAALALEREYGADACLQVAADFDWQKHPNYLRPILQERRDGNGSRESRRESTAAAHPDGVADGVSVVDRRRAAVAERGRERG